MFKFESLQKILTPEKVATEELKDVFPPNRRLDAGKELEKEAKSLDGAGQIGRVLALASALALLSVPSFGATRSERGPKQETRAEETQRRAGDSKKDFIGLREEVKLLKDGKYSVRRKELPLRGSAYQAEQTRATDIQIDFFKKGNRLTGNHFSWHQAGFVPDLGSWLKKGGSEGLQEYDILKNLSKERRARFSSETQAYAVSLDDIKQRIGLIMFFEQLAEVIESEGKQNNEEALLLRYTAAKEKSLLIQIYGDIINNH